MGSLISIITIVVVGFICAAITRWFTYLIGNPQNDTVNRGSIFSFYGIWLLNNYQKLEDQILESDSNKGYSRLNFYKALGVCPYCLNVYSTVFSGIVMLHLLELSQFWLLALPSLSHFWLGKIFDWEA